MAKQFNGELEVSADSTFGLQRKLVQVALSCDSGVVQSSFSYVTHKFAVFQVIVGGGDGGSFEGGGGVAAATSGDGGGSGGGAAAEAPAAEKKEESDEDIEMSLFDDE